MGDDQQTIAEQLAALDERAAGRLPAGAGAAFARERARLAAAGVPREVPGPGTPMPDGALLDAHGEPTTLAEVRAGRPAVVVFYRGAWCPYCNLTLRAYQQQLVPALDAAGVALVAVSPQKPDGSLTMRETNELTYAVVSDPGNRLAARLGILAVPGADARAALASSGVDPAAGNADGTDAAPMPTVVVVGADGAVRWIDVRPDWTSRTEPAAILAAVASLPEAHAAPAAD